MRPIARDVARLGALG